MRCSVIVAAAFKARHRAGRAKRSVIRRSAAHPPHCRFGLDPVELKTQGSRRARTARCRALTLGSLSRGEW